jgi:hypothetical protein
MKLTNRQCKGWKNNLQMVFYLLQLQLQSGYLVTSASRHLHVHTAEPHSLKETSYLHYKYMEV